MRKLFIRLLEDNGATTAIEYALIAMLIALAIVVAATSVGTQLASSFTAVQGAFP
ncbi:MAG: Flp family type IVb pilin [Alphaproteobacteria bacterium]